MCWNWSPAGALVEADVRFTHQSPALSQRIALAPGPTHFAQTRIGKTQGASIASPASQRFDQTTSSHPAVLAIRDDMTPSFKGMEAEISPLMDVDVNHPRGGPRVSACQVGPKAPAMANT